MFPCAPFSSFTSLNFFIWYPHVVSMESNRIHSLRIINVKINPIRFFIYNYHFVNQTPAYILSYFFLFLASSGKVSIETILLIVIIFTFLSHSVPFTLFIILIPTATLYLQWLMSLALHWWNLGNAFPDRLPIIQILDAFIKTKSAFRVDVSL